MIIQENISLQDKNWFKTGGAAQFYCEPTTAAEFQEAVLFAQKEALPIFVLGEGANLLISDDGFQGLVIHPQLKNLSIQDIDAQQALVTAGAGVQFTDLIDYCFDNYTSSLEEFSGIPGSVGGSVFINIHFFEFLLSQFLVSATIVVKETGELLTVDNAWFAFGYNYSTLHKKLHYLVDATFKVKKISELETAYGRGRRAEIIRYRSNRYPNKNTCGSFFRNFYPEEVTLEIGGKKMIYVAYYLDKLGVKGELACGGARVSYQHANMLVTNDQATSQDVITLMHTLQKLVFDAYHITPQPECQLIGFRE
jgi:UDP-N-acetylenolpyruvoylglucosamine reductase